MDAEIVDLRRVRSWTPDFAAMARSRFAEARRAAGMSDSAFAAHLTGYLDWPVTEGMVTGWESHGVPPSDIMMAAEILAGTADHPPVQPTQLIVGYRDLQDALASVVTGARRMLAITGSRSREPKYLARIEAALIENPGLEHWRVLYGPIRTGAMKSHLLRLFDLGLPESRLHIGSLPDLLLDEERFIVASERAAVLIVPSATSTKNFDTCVYLGDPSIAAAYVDHVTQAWLSSTHKVKDREAVEQMEVVR